MLRGRSNQSKLEWSPSADMQTKIKRIEPIAVKPNPGEFDRSELAARVGRTLNSPPPSEGSRSAAVGQSQRRELPPTLLKLEAQPLSAYDDNPVLNKSSAAFILGV